MNVEANHHERGAAAELAWVCRVLGVAADASPQQIQAAALDQLKKARFVPPPRLEQAVLLVADELPCDLWVRDGGWEMFLARERKLRNAVDRFTADFFTLEPAQRRAVWQPLKEQAAFSIPLTLRLDALQDGLDVTLPPLDGDEASPVLRLAKEVVETFTMLPSARSARHAEHLRRALAGPRHAQSTARSFQRAFPQLVPLASALIHALSQAVRLRKDELKDAERARKEKLRSAQGQQKVSWQPLLWIVFVVLGSVCGVLRFGSRSHDGPASSQPPAQNWVSPTTNRPQRSVSSSSTDADDLHELMKGGNHEVLPPPGPSYTGRKMIVDEAARRLFNVPDDVDVYREDGKCVYRRRAAPIESRDAVPRGVVPERKSRP